MAQLLQSDTLVYHLASLSMESLSYEWAGLKAFGVPVALACLASSRASIL